MKIKLLFICTYNITRSPTAEGLFSVSDKYEAKAAGIAPVAVIKITQELIDWADKIFVMSEQVDKHLTFLRNNFDIKDKEVYDLDIDDIYGRDNPELIKILKEKLSKHGIKY